MDMFCNFLNVNIRLNKKEVEYYDIWFVDWQKKSQCSDMFMLVICECLFLGELCIFIVVCFCFYFDGWEDMEFGINYGFCYIWVKYYDWWYYLCVYILKYVICVVIVRIIRNICQQFVFLRKFFCYKK